MKQLLQQIFGRAAALRLNAHTLLAIRCFMSILKAMSSKKTKVLFFLMLMVAAPFFFIGGPTGNSSTLFRALWDWGHILFFSVLAVVLQPIVKIKGWRYGLFISIAVLIVGGGIEILQSYTGRHGNWEDLFRDLSGAWFGLFWLQKSSLWVWVGRLVTFGLLLPSVWAVFLAALTQVQAVNHFPVLSDFEQYSDVQRWKGKVELSHEHVIQGRNSLKVFFNTQRYSPVALDEFLGDWRNYKNINVDIYNPQQEVIVLVVRVNDRHHDDNKGLATDRFNRKLLVTPGWNHIEIPLEEIEKAPESRLMDLDEVTRLLFFTSKLPEPKILYFDNLMLK
ncbi:MAG: hypothetical protein EOO68_03015 [Moraxellaceae bacterium]|nr:MAG: hypothetical protein EOO68_03015 [Moraxellaceae bacterium]